MPLQRRARDRRPRQRHQLLLERGPHPRRQRRIGRHQDRPRLDVVLGLRDQVGRDPARVRARVGDDQHLRRPRHRVDVDLPEHQPLGRRHPLIARAHDLVDARHRLGPVRQRRHRLRAADLEHPIDPRQPGRRQRLRRRARRHHHDLADARHLGRDRGHQHRRRIARGATRHVQPDPRQRRHPQPEPHPAIVDVQIDLALMVVEPPDPLRRVIERGQHLRRHRRGAPRPLVGIELVATIRARGPPIEPLGVLAHRVVAAHPHRLDDRRHLRLHLRREPHRSIEQRCHPRIIRADRPQHGHPTSRLASWSWSDRSRPSRATVRWDRRARPARARVGRCRLAAGPRARPTASSTDSARRTSR